MDKLSKKILSLFILFNLFMMPVFAASDGSLPELPNLPEFDTVLPPDGLDVFAPSATSPEIAPKPVQNSNSTVKPAQTSVPQKAIPQKTEVKTNKVNAQTNQQKTVQNSASTVKKQVVKSSNNSYYQNNKLSFIVPKGKKFKVNLLSSVSSSTPKGARVSFKSIYPETSRYITIPAGTVFYGKVTDTHGPQLTGNGGLIVIEVNQMVYKGSTYNIDAKISVANGKRIFLNNIKGKRMYWRSFPKALKPGTTFFKKMWRVTCKLAKNESGVEIILTPFSFLTGAVVYAVNFVASPVIAIFYKGKSITIPSGSQFIIQLREDAVLYK